MYKSAYENESNMDGVTINGKEYSSMEEYLYGRRVVANAKIGEYVNYKCDYDNDGNTKDDWRVFYNDEKNVYLISNKYTATGVKLNGLRSRRRSVGLSFE